MQIAHKIEIKPNKSQIQLLRKACGCARFTYNWALNAWQHMYQAHKVDKTLPKPNANLIKKEFNKIKKTQFPWIYESPKDANQQPFANLNNAFTRFFKKLGKFPKFKKKKNNESFYVSNDKFKIIDQTIQLPIIGKVPLTEKLRFQGKIINATVSTQGGKWFVSIVVDSVVVKKKKIKKQVVGIDLGLINFATLEDGKKFKSPKPLKKYEKILKRRQRQYSKKQVGSNNKFKSAMKLNKLHYKISCKRKDFLHKLSTKICCENQVICLENLKVQNMMKNHKLAKAISDTGWSEFRRQIQYKSQIYGNDVVVADQFYASSKTCSNCGCKKKELSLKDRVFVCDICNFKIDRDVNAARNLSRLGLEFLRNKEDNRINACGHLASVASALDVVS